MADTPTPVNARLASDVAWDAALRFVRGHCDVPSEDTGVRWVLALWEALSAAIKTYTDLRAREPTRLVGRAPAENRGRSRGTDAPYRPVTHDARLSPWPTRSTRPATAA